MKTWIYWNAAGAEVMRVLRFNLPDGSKQFRPLHRVDGGWRIGDPPGLLPLYRPPELSNGPIYVCEGEKAADAAAALELNATTSAHGAASAGKSDWSPLAGREVVILPDADEAGERYARDVSRILLTLNPATKIKLVKLPGLGDGEDIADYVDAHPNLSPTKLRRRIVKLGDAADVLKPADVLGGALLLQMNEVEPKPVTWLWRDRIALGRLTLLVGMPGVGKSYLTTDLAARVTTGTAFPDGSRCPSGDVLLISAEDDPADTIGPRLDAHNADASRVHLLRSVRHVDDAGKASESAFALADLPSLEQVLKSHPALKLVVVDPIGSYLGAKVDAHRDNEIRAVLARLAMLASAHNVAVAVVAHRRKGSSTFADDTAIGSRAFTGIARSVWHLSRDPADNKRRLLLPGKQNLSAEPNGLAFKIAGDPPALVWEAEPLAMSADDALAAENAANIGRPPEERDAATEWLRAEIGDNAPHPVADRRRDADAAGVSWHAVRRAAAALQVARERDGFQGGYTWRLPNDDSSAQPAQNPKHDTFAQLAQVGKNNGNTHVSNHGVPKLRKSRKRINGHRLLSVNAGRIQDDDN